MLRFLGDHRLLDGALDQHLHLVGQLAARGIEELDAVVLVRIVRGADDHAEAAAQALGHVGDAGRGQRPDQHDIDAGGDESRLQRRLEHVARQAGVFADEHAAALRRQHARGGTRQPQREIHGHGRLADAAAHAIGAEVTNRHGCISPPNTALTMRMASRVGSHIVACARSAHPGSPPAPRDPGSRPSARRWAGRGSCR